MEREAIVARIEGDFALLKLDAAAGGCGRCSETGGCGTGVLNQFFKPICPLHKLPNSVNAKVGDRVVLSTPDGVVWRAALVLYGVPLMLGLAGAAAGGGRSEGWAVAGLLVGLAAGIGCAAFVVRSPVWARFRPRMLRAGPDAGRSVRFVRDVI